MLPETLKEQSCDVVVIGGGPGGSTAASLLAERGYRVALLEKAHHPRFHIGESLLPANLPLLERLGVLDQVRSVGMEKYGAEFVSMWDGRHQEFQFANAWNKALPMSYQVQRSQFDEILIRRAAQLGADVNEGCQVDNVEFLPAKGGVRVHAQYDDGRRSAWHAETVIDASGRDTFLGNQLRAKRRNTKHASAAMYAHFTGAQREPGKREGNITIFWFDHGWFWFIPLMNGITSVGAVVWPNYLKTRSGSLESFFKATIAKCPPLAAKLAAAELASPVEATGNYSYACDRSYGDNYLLIGDAFTFIDPVFSTGVMLAMNSGSAAADAYHQCHTEPAKAARTLRRFDREMRHGPKQFSWFIYRVTNPTMRELFLGPRNVLRMEEALLSMLAGDIFGKTPIWRSLLLFKGVYHFMSLANLTRTLKAARRRAANIRPELEHVTGG